MLSWVGYIRCDLCGERLKFDNRIEYNDLNICQECNARIIEKSKPTKRYTEDGLSFKKDLPEKSKSKSKKK